MRKFRSEFISRALLTVYFRIQVGDGWGKDERRLFLTGRKVKYKMYDPFH